MTAVNVEGELEYLRELEAIAKKHNCPVITAMQGRAMFPIINGPSVPWEVLAPHESMAQKNHGQSLERLAERGGLGPSEAYCIVHGIDSVTLINYNQCKKFRHLWFMYAEKVNHHYDLLDKTQKELQATRETLAAKEKKVNELAIRVLELENQIVFESWKKD